MPKKPEIAYDKIFKILPGEMPSDTNPPLAPAYYPYPRKIGDAGDEVLVDANWGYSEGTRQTDKD
jgi:hypothetical protein